MKLYLSSLNQITSGLKSRMALCIVVLILVGATAFTGNRKSLFLPPDTIYIDIAALGDKELFMRFGGPSDPQAKAAAKNFMDTILNRVISKYEPIFNGYNPTVHIYKFRIIANDVIMDDYPLYGGFLKDQVIWGNHRGFWEFKYPCATDNPDILHVFSGHSAGQLRTPLGESFYGWSPGSILDNNKCLPGHAITLHGVVGSNEVIRDSLYNLALVAHEIGHNFGLLHLEDGLSACKTLCASQAYLMCKSNNNSTQLTSCDYTILQNTLTDTIAINCLKPAIQVSVDSNCMHCQVTIMDMNNPEVLASGCEGYEEVEFATEVWNNCDSAGRRIRLEFSKLGFEVVDAGIFTAMEVGSLMVLRILDSTGQEKPVVFAPEEKKAFSVRLKLKDDLSGLSFSSILVRTNVYSGGGSLLATKERRIHYAIQIGTSSTSITDSLPATAVAILLNGRLDFTSPIEYENDTLRYIFCAPGAAMRISNQKSVFRTIQILGCSAMWNGITVISNSTLELDKSSVQDAQYGLTIQKGATVFAKSSQFLNNNFAIRTDPNGTGSYNITLLGNHYGTTGAGLKPAYSGQSPAPLNKGFAGLYLKNAGSVNIDHDPLTNESNRFFNLKFGIISDNTELNVRSARFEDITQVPKGSGYTGFAPGLTGRSVYARKGTTSIIKGLEGQQLVFSNCHTGVETLDGSAYVWKATMTGMTNGIITTNGNYSVHWYNTIEATDRGIELRHSSPLGFPPASISSTIIGGIYENTITMTGNAKSIAINLAGNKMIAVDPTGAPNDPPQFTGGNISGNIITLNDGATGININVARKLSAYSNHITLANNQDANRGIALNAGDQNAVTCNTVKAAGTGDYTGLYAIHADRAKLRCNFADAIGVGLRVEGLLAGKTKADIAGNLFQDNTTGLLYGVDAISGQQMHRGNRWSGNNTLAEHQGIAAVAIFSKYTIDEAEDTEFLPMTRIPQNWFEDSEDTISSYLCPDLPDVCIRADNLTDDEPDQALDEKTALGELPGEYYQDANNWLAQRRLYERIAEEGNPYSSNTDIAGFLTAAQSNGLADYADIQTGIRQTLVVSQADQDSLQLYESRILEGLDSLARLEGQLYTLGISEQDSIDLSDQRADLLQMVQASASAKQNLVNIIDSLGAIAADNLLLQNDNLPDLGKPYTANEKTVNDILLRTVLHGIFTFSSQDSAILESIAALCPLSVGESVMRARALLALVWGTPQSYEDEANCIAERSRRKQPSMPDQFRIYPNPATDRITVEQSGDETSEQTFLLFNALGQVVKTAILLKEQNSTRILLNGVPAGIYWYRVNGMQAAIRSGKIIINQ